MIIDERKKEKVGKKGVGNIIILEYTYLFHLIFTHIFRKYIYFKNYVWYHYYEKYN